jgi:spermidine synthase
LALGSGALGIKLDGRTRTDTMMEVERLNSNFGLMQVFKDNHAPRLYYLNDYLMQNGYDTERKQSVHAFTYMLHGLAHAYTDKIETALCIGMGIGIVPMQLAREGVSTDVVEINPAVVPLAQRHFDFDPPRVNLFLDDGRHFLNDPPRPYDAILLDAFLGDSSPSHLMTREAFTKMRDALKPGGTLVINTFAHLDRGRDFYGASLEKTLQAVFRSVKIHMARHGGNVYFVASDRQPLEFLHQPSWETAHPEVQPTLQSAFVGIVGSDLSHGQVLTDDFNPVEYYDAANRETTRRGLASSMTRNR